jgi:hypothetical protein
MTEHPPSSQRLVFAIIAIKGKPALPVNFAPAFTGAVGQSDVAGSTWGRGSGLLDAD